MLVVTNPPNEHRNRNIQKWLDKEITSSVMASHVAMHWYKCTRQYDY